MILSNQMVKYSSKALNQIFFALSDPTRRAMLRRLDRRVLSVSELARPFKMSAPAALKHVRVLERAGLLRGRKQGRVRYCVIQAEAMKEAADWFDQYRAFWEEQLDALDRYLLAASAKEAPAREKPHSRTPR
jgi:DNA-binding transcriptional ArsR family regulator